MTSLKKVFQLYFYISFIAGTSNRWEVVASFVNQHSKSSDSNRTAKETLAQAKHMQQGDYHKSSLKEEVNKKAYENLEKQKKREVKVDDAEASTRTGNVQVLVNLTFSFCTLGGASKLFVFKQRSLCS